MSLTPGSDAGPPSRASALPGFIDDPSCRREPLPAVPAREVPLLVLIAAGLTLTLADFALPFWPWANAGITVLEIGLIPLWSSYALRRLRRETPAFAARRSRRSAWPTLIAVAFLACHIASLAAKGALVLEALESADGGARALAAYRNFVVLAFATYVPALLVRARSFELFLARVASHTARLMALTFAAAALLGAFLLTLPAAVYDVASISFGDALFTSVSAVCVTGLTVNNVSRTYTPFGQAVILALVQVGGLGIMVLYSFFMVVTGQRLSARGAKVMAEMVDLDSFARLRRTLAGIVLFTVVVETLGAAALFALFKAHPEVAAGPELDAPASGAGSVLWAAVFHAVSAYCNAGFSLFRDGMLPFAGGFGVSLTIMALVVLGGIGFPVCFELLGYAWRRARLSRAQRLSLHTRSALVSSAILLVAGTLAYLVLEWGTSMRALSLDAKLLTAMFQSTITRSSGFNTLDYGAMGAATWLVTCVLMFIGASPGSTGGGIKTTTLAVLFATFRAELTGRHRAELGGRSLSDASVRRALSVTFLSVGAVVVATFALLITDGLEPLRTAFEVVSALATVGLSTGITAELSVPGKLIIAFSMYLGRIGPLTLALALTEERMKAHIELPEERIGIG